MPRYTYRAKSSPGSILQGEIHAQSPQDAVAKLTRMGFFPLSVETEAASLDSLAMVRLHRVGRRDIALFARQLASLVGSGVNILNSLAIISNQTHNRYFTTIINECITRIKEGRALSESLSMHPHVFSNVFISMVHAGEVGGNLEVAIGRLAEYLEKEEEFTYAVRAALAYPLFVFSVGMLTVFVLLWFVVPRLVAMFEDMGQTLPFATRLLIGTSDVVRLYWWGMAAAMATGFFLLYRVYRTQKGRIVCDGLLLKSVLLGSIILKTEISRLTRTFSLLLSSGIPILQALDIAEAVVGNTVLKQEVQRFRAEIRNGASLSRCLKDSVLLPAFVANIVTVGEETGTLEKSLLRIAEEYEKETDRTLKTLTRLIEPVMILVMGLMVGFIVLAMLLPIFQINLLVR